MLAATIPTQKDGMCLIAAERKRQVAVKGWTPKHDDGHATGDLASAAFAYARMAKWQACMELNDRDFKRFSDSLSDSDWPWDDGFNPSRNPIRNLEKAGALIAAEIDRLLRKANSVQDGTEAGAAPGKPESN